MLTTRFCLAPTSSSPSTSRIFPAEAFSKASSGTLPPSETSVISWETQYAQGGWLRG